MSFEYNDKKTWRQYFYFCQSPETGDEQYLEEPIYLSDGYPGIGCISSGLPFMILSFSRVLRGPNMLDGNGLNDF